MICAFEKTLHGNGFSVQGKTYSDGGAAVLRAVDFNIAAASVYDAVGG